MISTTKHVKGSWSHNQTFIKARKAYDNRHDYEDVFPEVKEINVLMKLWDAGVAYVSPKEDSDEYVFFVYRITEGGTTQFNILPNLGMMLQCCRTLLVMKQNEQ